MTKQQPLLKALTLAREEFGRRVRSTMAWKAGVRMDEEGRLVVPFFGRTYRVPPPPGQEIPVVEEILLLHYLTRAAGLLPAGEWVSFKELPNGFIYHVPFNQRVVRPLLKVFGSDPQALLDAGRKLGGEELSLGDAAVALRALPRFPLAYVLWAGDEEFPPQATVLFDTTAPAYFSTEDCVWLAQLGVNYLAAAQKGVGFENGKAL
ncbi:conserved hypothetical protein [Ammonifex degensii KC4]|uniref:DUF3786 domain-containing protein n=1 Tax=Ammonifex degensii (strain DSM 10501 / KC4) TaxID=429009 RepID=C9RBH1_AMMDK|nr:DUF3786 domain-containing protein [Ammonifex degensii]ACX51598.1 conserved hypothetical protein [Ammonifex degensii KC4]